MSCRRLHDRRHVSNLEHAPAKAFGLGAVVCSGRVSYLAGRVSKLRRVDRGAGGCANAHG
jgi:hypothetical protein